MTVRVKDLLLDNSGQALVEHSLIIFFIITAVIIILPAMGERLSEFYTAMAEKWFK